MERKEKVVKKGFNYVVLRDYNIPSTSLSNFLISFFSFLTRHQQSTIRTNICNSPNTQVLEPYSRYRSSIKGFIPIFGFLQKPHQGHPGLVFCQGLGGYTSPFFFFNHHIPGRDQKFSCLCHNWFFSSSPFGYTVKYSSWFSLLSNRNPFCINQNSSYIRRPLFGKFHISGSIFRLT